MVVNTPNYYRNLRVGTEDVVINETTCNAASAGTTTVTLTN
ncbi:MAG: hypothetical protein R2753_11825 [Chitinophagales bacterium]